MIILKSKEEVSALRMSGQLAARVLGLVREKIRPGVSTVELNDDAEAFILKNGAKPAFKGYRGYKHALCISVNEQVVHGVPSKRALKEGDIVGIDCGVLLNGFYGDCAWTFPVGKVSTKAKKLMEIGEKALWAGIKMVKAGNRLYDISAAIQETAEKEGFSVVRDMVGHGIGRSLHEEPQVPNYGQKGTGIKLRPGLVLALEPMVNEGTWEIKTLDDGWTVVTKDGLLSAHFEHMVAVTDGEPQVLSLLN